MLHLDKKIKRERVCVCLYAEKVQLKPHDRIGLIPSVSSSGSFCDPIWK